MRRSLRAWRAERMLTQRALAEAVGVKRHATIADIEAGRRTPRLGTMQRIADALEVEVRDVAEFSDALDRMAYGKEKRPQVET